MELERHSCIPLSLGDSIPNTIQLVHQLVQSENAKTILLNVPLKTACNKNVTVSRLGSSPGKHQQPLEVGINLEENSKTGGEQRNIKPSKRREAPRVRSASVGRDKRSDLQARYWSFLFENLRRAVDDLYSTSEDDESIPAVREVILVLENCVRDFYNLADWLQFKKEYENTPPINRPTSLAWEVRMTLPTVAFSSKNKLLLATKGLDITNKLVSVGVQAQIQGERNIKDSKVSEVEDTNEGGIKDDNEIKFADAIISNLKDGDNQITSKITKPTTGTKNMVRNYSSVTASTSKYPVSPVKKAILKKVGVSNLDDLDKQPKDTRNGVWLSRSKSNSKIQRITLIDRHSQIAAKNVMKSKILPFVSRQTNVNELSASNKYVKKRRQVPALSQKRTLPHVVGYVQHPNKQTTVGSLNEVIAIMDTDKRVDESDLNANTKVESDDGWKKVMKRQRGCRQRHSPGKNVGFCSSESVANSNMKLDECVLSPSNFPSSSSSMPILNLNINEEKTRLSLVTREDFERDSKVENEIHHIDLVTSNFSNQFFESSGLISNDSKDVKDVQADIEKHDNAIALAEQEEETLALKIMETQKSEIFGEEDKLVSSRLMVMTTSDKVSEMSWADQVEFEEQLQASDSGQRLPGRAIYLHDKLSSPARKQDPEKTFLRYQEKQKNAKLRREKFQDDKAGQLAVLSERIKEVTVRKEQLMKERRDITDVKMVRAEAKRLEYLESIRRKAHEEETKIKEIAFINELQAQNIRIDQMVQKETSDKKTEKVLDQLAEERAKKAEQREAKEARAEEKRRNIEQVRIKCVTAMLERNKLRNKKIEAEHEQAKRDREETAREKAREREEKLSIIRAAEEEQKSELQEKIAQKQEEVAKRHYDRLQRIRLKAFELTVLRCGDENDAGVPPFLKTYDIKKKCNLCNVLILSDVHLQSHLRSPKHLRLVRDDDGNDFNNVVDGSRKAGIMGISEMEIQGNCNLRVIVDASPNELDPIISKKKNRAKIMRKRIKNIRHSMALKASQRQLQPLPESINAPNRAKIGKYIRGIEKLLNSQGHGAWPESSITQLERGLGDLCRILDKSGVSEDKVAFIAMAGFDVLTKIFRILNECRSQSCPIPLKTIVTCSRTWAIASKACNTTLNYLIFANCFNLLVDVLQRRLEALMTCNSGSLPTQAAPLIDNVANSLMNLLTTALEDLSAFIATTGESDEIRSGVQDQVTYIVSIGIVDQLASYFCSVYKPINSHPDLGNFILSSLQFLSALIRVLSILDPSRKKDSTNLLEAFKLTDLAGTVSMLYGMLLLQGSPPRGSTQLLDPLPTHTLCVALASGELLHRLAVHDLFMVQQVLGSEGISLEFRHIASYLLNYCVSHLSSCDLSQQLLNKFVILVGYFTALHSDNQAIIQSGHRPSVLQRLCCLPFVYFVNPELKQILMPSLLACCYGNDTNRAILQADLNWNMIEEFVSSSAGVENHLVQFVLSSLSVTGCG